MAYYAYKKVRDLIPNEFRETYMEYIDPDYEGESNYDGDLWSLTAQYIDYLLRVDGISIEDYFKGFVTQ